MATAALVMSLVGTGMQFISGMQEASAIKEAGQAKQRQKEYEAAQAAELEKQEFASSQRKNIEERRRKELVLSNTLAEAGKGGGLDSSFAEIMTSLSGEGRYRQEVAMYEGYDNKLKRKQQADMLRYEGEQAAISASAQAKAKRFSTMGNAALGTVSAGSNYNKATKKSPILKSDIRWSTT